MFPFDLFSLQTFNTESFHLKRMTCVLFGPAVKFSLFQISVYVEAHPCACWRKYDGWEF